MALNAKCIKGNLGKLELIKYRSGVLNTHHVARSHTDARRYMTKSRSSC